ncbi:MAG: hypothetical protein ACYTEW_20080 [Planctomycetota bacterium]|jgi:hypothetical protein
MKKFWILVACTFVVICPVLAPAQTDESLGGGGVRIKMAYLGLTDSILDDFRIDHPTYVGAEVYWKVHAQLYVGGEVGYANDESSATIVVGTVASQAQTEITYVPIELNVMNILSFGEHVQTRFGIGVSYNYVHIESDPPPGGVMLKSSDDDEEWLLGGQLFADISYQINNFFFGLDLKVQMTRDWDEEDYTNGRIGGHMGWRF